MRFDIKRLAITLVTIVLVATALPLSAFASQNTNTETAKLRRPVSPEQPMWIVHIDTWNYADPAKIIDLIPKDILPYVVFNISMSISWDSNTKTWGLVNDGYELAKSWLRTCAEKQVWAMIQPASGGQCHFPDYPNSSLEGTLFEEFFRDYPNFLGFNYCEQFWGFEQPDFPITPTDRYKHFANLLKLTNKYGGYLVVSWCGNQWGQDLNPIAMLKRVPEFEKACRQYSQNYILCEKYTQWGYLNDMASSVLGAYLSGYCGNFGIRYDETGWCDENGAKANGDKKDTFIQATGLGIQIERLMQSGLTVIDGPELIWADDFKEVGAKTVSGGYKSRAWEMYNQFQNINIDLFRKVIDGTIRIPSRQEVIDKTKVVIIQDVSTSSHGTADSKYCSPTTLYRDLYQMSDDGQLKDNHSHFKSTGRYPTIPVVYGLLDDAAKSFEIQVKQTEYYKRWRKLDDKVSEFNKLFSEEYTGDLYARSNENSWTLYNPFKTDKNATGNLKLKYNTIDSMSVTLSRYSSGIINENSDSLSIYLNNYDEDHPSVLKTDVIKLYGCTDKPKVSYKDRGVNQTKSYVTAKWDNGSYTLTVKHNGPVDITISCSGKAKSRLTDYKSGKVTAPQRPPLYTGDRQYEAEHFEYKNINKVVSNGCRTGVSKFTGQGYMIFGRNSSAAVRDTVSVLDDGVYTFSLRYSCASTDVRGLELYINGEKITALSLKKTGSNSKWQTSAVKVNLKKGSNTFELKASQSLTGDLYLDNVVLSADK